MLLYREVLKEDESGSLKATVEEILFQSKRKRCVCMFRLSDRLKAPNTGRELFL